VNEISNFYTPSAFFFFGRNPVLKTHRTARKLIRQSVVIFIVCHGAISQHGHDVRKDNARSIVLVGVDEET
jgi:hypothetical protein